MEYSAVKRAVLELIDQYSVAGEQVALSYNNQSDYVHRIPNLINHGIMDIRMTVKPKLAVRELRVDNPTDHTQSAWQSFPLGPDFRQLVSGGVRLMTDSGPQPRNTYRLTGDNRIWLPPGHWLVEYERFPEQLPADPADTYDIDEPPDILQAAFYYAAAYLVQREDEFMFSTFNAEYVDRKENLRPRLSAESVPIADVYSPCCF